MRNSTKGTGGMIAVAAVGVALLGARESKADCNQMLTARATNPNTTSYAIESCSGANWGVPNYSSQGEVGVNYSGNGEDTTAVSTAFYTSSNGNYGYYLMGDIDCAASGMKYTGWKGPYYSTLWPNSISIVCQNQIANFAEGSIWLSAP